MIVSNPFTIEDRETKLPFMKGKGINKIKVDTSISCIVPDVEDTKAYMEYIFRLMCTQYLNISGSDQTGYNFMNGEAYINHRMNDGFGADLHSGISMSMWGAGQVSGSEGWDQPNYVVTILPWAYSYNIIEKCNILLEYLNRFLSLIPENQFIKAQALTMRAHAYTKILQYYAPRWEDSNNGQEISGILQLTTTDSDTRFATMKEIADVIYNDLDEAISLFISSGKERLWKQETDLNVAYGLYARIAMIVHDYPKAQLMAHNAYQGYEILDNTTLFSGLFEDNNDYMWISTEQETGLYYWSELCMTAPNGYYTTHWMTPNAIDLDLYNKMDENDVRRMLFFMPDKIAYVQNVSSAYNPGKITEFAFWDPSLVNQYNLCDVSIGSKTAAKKPYGLYNVGVYYCNLYKENLFTGDLALISMADPDGGTIYDYININSRGAIQLSTTEYATLYTLPFGAQFKFFSKAPYSSGAQSWMRSTEFRFLEAEAAFYNGDEALCRHNLNEIQSIRIPGYNFTGTGQALLDELRLAYRIETWGEGHNWTDFKRWNLPITRRPWVANDPTSGNWQPDFGIDTPIDVNDGWRMNIPYSQFASDYILPNTYLKSVPNSICSTGPLIRHFYLATQVEFDLNLPQGLSLADLKVSYEDNESQNLNFRCESKTNNDIHVQISRKDNKPLGDVVMDFIFESGSSLIPSFIYCKNKIFKVLNQEITTPDEKLYVTGYNIVMEDLILDEGESYQLPNPIPGAPDYVSYEWKEWKDYHYFISETGLLSTDNPGKCSYFLMISDVKNNFNMTFKASLIVIPFYLGDANDNQNIDIADIVATSNYLTGYNWGLFNFVNADVNFNDYIDPDDVDGIASIILTPLHADNEIGESFQQEKTDPCWFEISNLETNPDGTNRMVLDFLTDYPFTALQMNLKMSESSEITSIKLTEQFNSHCLKYSTADKGGTGIVIYSSGLNEFPTIQKHPMLEVTFTGKFKAEDSVNISNLKVCDILGQLTEVKDFNLLLENAGISALPNIETECVKAVEGGIFLDLPSKTNAIVSDSQGRIMARINGSRKVSVPNGIYIIKFDRSDRIVKVMVR
ncbi:MAG: RagB/SusD family nutrient uptake outer membrane protein [Muribaculaceae bacterium]|nr:RagB/SusD family nutrient uptake outer membrane protein [Muribaculaceae bacterium]